MKRALIISLSILITGTSLFYFLVYPRLAIVSGYNAKILCSCLFVSEMDKHKATTEDLGFSLLWLASNKIDYNAKTVKSHVLGMHYKTAVYREGLGCTLIHKDTDEEFPKITLNTDSLNYAPEIWPPSEVKGNEAMQQAIHMAFDDNQNNEFYRTRAVVVIKNGKIIGERYGEGFSKDSKLLGWSMTKSVTAAMAGILARKGYWKTTDHMPIPEWTHDQRSEIQLEHVLTQTTGLHWNEDYSNVSTATVMLYNKTNMGHYAASQSLESKPGTVWEYSSGNSNILASSMRPAFKSEKDYLLFPHRELFAPIGVRNFVIETDAANQFVGSSYGYAPARDWAKIGLLYLNMGNWYGQQIIDTAWVKQSVIPTPASKGKYGYQFWLNQNKSFENYDEDAYWMSGFQGQQVSIHPKEKLVVVRIGLTYDQRDFPFDTWIKTIKKAAKD